jgi:hypothetical protein
MMNFLQQVEQYQRLHNLIEQSKTGTPQELAEILNISRSKLYLFLDNMKSIDAPIKYDRSLKSFFYDSSFKLDIEVNIKTITPTEARIIYGGSFFKKSSSVLFVGRNKPKLTMQSSTTLQAKLTA